MSRADVSRNSRAVDTMLPFQAGPPRPYLTGMLLFQMSRYIFQPPSAFL